MPRVSKMHKAKNEKNNEFYTFYSDIEREMNAYLEYDENVFKGKTILLPCDDPEWSNFTKFFAQNFERFGIKKLISTSYAADSKPSDIPYQLTLFETESPKFDKKKTRSHGKIFVLEKDKNNDKKIDINDLDWSYLKGDGDFRSDEIKKLRDEADIIITNPPFSLFKEFFNWIMESNKKFAFIINKASISNKDVFPYFMKQLVWSGKEEWAGGMWFETFSESNDYDKIKDGKKYKNVAAIWITNIDHGRRHEPIPLMTMEENIRYSKYKEVRGKEYQKYDNYDAIEVPYTSAIPRDYSGLMGVPITFLEKFCPEQFEIVGATQRGCHELVPELKTYDEFKEINYKTGKPTGSSGNKTNGNGNLPGIKEKNNYFLNEKTGEIVHSNFSRIFIKSKEPK